MSKKTFLLQSSDNKRAVSFFSNLTNDFCEIRFLSLEKAETVALESGTELQELDYSEVLVMTVKEEDKAKYFMAAYRFIDCGQIQVNGLTVFSGL